MIIKWGKTTTVTLFLFSIMILSLSPFVQNARSMELRDVTDESWNIDVVYEIIKIDENGNANIRAVCIFTFSEQKTASTDYELSIKLGKIVGDDVTVHPTIEENYEFAQYFNYSFQKSDGDTFVDISFSSNISSIYKIYYISLNYSIQNLAIKKSEGYEVPIRWELQYVSKHSHIFDPEYRVYVVLPKNARIDYGNANITHPSEINEHIFNYILALPWSGTTHPGVKIDVSIPKVENYTIVYVEEKFFPDNGKLIFHYNTPNTFLGLLGIVGLVAGIIGSIVGIIGWYHSIKTSKILDNLWSKIAEKEEFLNSEEIKVRKGTKSSGSVDKLDALLLAIPSIIGIFGILIQLIINVFISFTEIIYYIALPALFFTIVIPLYIGYWRGVLVKNSIIERIRGWIYLVLGTVLYIISIVVVFTLIILTLLLSFLNIFLIIIIIVLTISFFYFLVIRIFKNIHPFVDRLFKICGKKSPPTNLELLLVFRTYISVTLFAAFFYLITTFIIINKFITPGNWLSYIIKLLGMGIPLIYVGIKSENDTEKFLEKSMSLKKLDKKTIDKLRKKSQLFFILAVFFIIPRLLFDHLILEGILFTLVGLALYFSLSYVIGSLPYLISKKKDEFEKGRKRVKKLIKN